MYCFQRTTRAHDAGSTPLLFMGKLSDDNGGSNRDGEKPVSLDWQNSNFAFASRVFCPLFCCPITHEEPQAVIFLHGIWRHIKEFGIEGQIPRISSPAKLEKRC